MEKYNINKYVQNWAHGKPYYTTTNKYVAHIKENKQSKYLGIFNTIEEAHDCYKVNKSKQLIELANKYKDKLTFKVYETLVNYNKNIDKY